MVFITSYLWLDKLCFTKAEKTVFLVFYNKTRKWWKDNFATKIKK